MTRTNIALTAAALTLLPGVAAAHPGHLVAANGHDHLALLAGLALIALAAAPVLIRLARRFW